MQSLYKKSILLATILLLLASCQILDQAPEHVISEVNFWKTGRDAEAAIVSVYDRAQSLRDGNIIALNNQSDEASSIVNNDRYDEFDRNEILADNNRVEQYWDRNYNGIHRANDVLSRVPGIKDATFLIENRERILGEAHFMRAYFYFNLVRLYGGVPLITEPYTTFKTNFTIEKSTPAQIYAQIFLDMEEAEKRLPESYKTAFETRGRATKGAAKALLARIYLYRKDYQKVVEKSSELMAMPMYSLVSKENYAAMFTSSGKNSTESILEFQFISSNTEGNDVYSRYLPSAKSGSPANTGGNYWARPSDKILLSFTPEDIRLNVNIAMSTNPPFNQAGLPYINKYKRTTAGDDVNIFVIRLADIILMRAEALNELNRPEEALPFVNQIRQRAGLLDLASTSQAELRDSIANERFLEFAFEGQRWHDLVRTGKAKEVLNLLDDNRLLWPIPARERNVNPKLTQNPGY